jgi:dynamin 1-like protein
VNRSQSDIASGVDMSTARANERAWFEAHREVYATETDDFDSSNDNLQVTTEDMRLHQKKNNLGTDALVSALVHILGEQVRRKIPKIRDTVEMSANALEMELARLGPATPHFPDRGALVHEVLRGCDAYERDFADELDKGTSPSNDSGGGEAIRNLFESVLLKNLNAVNLEAFYDPKRVRKVVDASDGFQPHLVAPEMGIRRLIELGLETLHEPVERCVAQVDAVLQSTMRKALRRHAGDAEKTSFLAAALAPRVKHPDRNLGSFRTSTSTFASSPLRRYPRLREAVVAAAADALHRLRRDAHAMTSAMVDMEAAYFDAEFFRKARAERARDGDENPDSTRTKIFPPSSPNAELSDYSDSSSRLKTIASSVRLYVEAVRDRLAKTVPKAIVFRQVAVARRGVLATFADRVGGVDDAELRAWMEEDPAVSRRRALCRERLELLDKAREEIQVAMGER